MGPRGPHNVNVGLKQVKKFHNLLDEIG
ncbi:unnamed protein product, partial [Rotaria magnacalcarata]